MSKINGEKDCFLPQFFVKKEHGETGLTGVLAKWHKARAINGILIWVISGILAFAFPIFSRFVFVFLFLIILIINRYYKNKMKREL